MFVTYVTYVIFAVVKGLNIQPSKPLTPKDKMQSNDLNLIDARTFPEIYKSMPAAMQRTMREQLSHQMNVTRATVYNWANGTTTPPYDDIKKKVQQILQKNFGINANFQSLFPKK